MQDPTYCLHAWRYVKNETTRVSHIDCDRPAVFACSHCGSVINAVCGATDASKCSPCGQKHKVRVGVVARVPMEAALAGSVWLITFTAPGSTPHSHRGVLCPCTTPDTALDTDEKMAAWNGDLTKRFNHVVTELRRSTFGKHGAKPFEGAEIFRAVEPQKRGALHVHALVRLTHSTAVPLSVLRRRVREIAIRYGFGHEVDLQRIGGKDIDARKASYYVAKYVSKGAGRSVPMPERPYRCAHLRSGFTKSGEAFENFRGINVYVGHMEEKDCGCSRTRPRRVRLWSASRKWGVSMATVKIFQQEFSLGRCSKTALKDEVTAIVAAHQAVF